MPIFDVFFVQQ
jgi:hypothetical protein